MPSKFSRDYNTAYNKRKKKAKVATPTKAPKRPTKKKAAAKKVATPTKRPATKKTAPKKARKVAVKGRTVKTKANSKTKAQSNRTVKTGAAAVKRKRRVNKQMSKIQMERSKAKKKQVGRRNGASNRGK